MSHRLVAIACIAALSLTSARESCQQWPTADSSAPRTIASTARFFFRDRWNLRNFFVGALKYLKSGLEALIGGNDKDHAGRIGRIDRDKISYSGYQVFRIEIVQQKEVDMLAGMPDEIEGIDFWTPPVIGHHADVLVPPDAAADVKTYLKKRLIEYEVMVQDLQMLISYENPKMSKQRRDMLMHRRGHPVTWTMYHRFPDILKFIEVLPRTFPKFVEVITAGYSSEGRPLKVIKISNSESTKNKKEYKKKAAVWIDGGMHGREWITSSVVMFIIKELVEKYKRYKDVVDETDWYLMPVANPDGYEYSHLVDRLWKKTRSKFEVKSSDLITKFLRGSCEGVDLNQNFNFRWGEKGHSSDPCSQSYAGPKPFSEPESRAISNFIMDHKDNLKIFITLHAYSQMWLIPSGYKKNKTSDFDEMKRMATKAVEAIRGVLGTYYDIGMSSMFYPLSGASQDWAKGVAKIKYSYLVEVRDRGHYGFLLPANQILPTAKEIFNSVMRLVKIVISRNAKDGQA